MNKKKIIFFVISFLVIALLAYKIIYIKEYKGIYEVTYTRFNPIRVQKYNEDTLIAAAGFIPRYINGIQYKIDCRAGFCGAFLYSGINNWYITSKLEEKRFVKALKGIRATRNVINDNHQYLDCSEEFYYLPPAETVKASPFFDSKYFSFDIPYNIEWGNERFAIPQYWEDYRHKIDYTIKFGNIMVGIYNKNNNCNYLREFEIVFRMPSSEESTLDEIIEDYVKNPVTNVNLFEKEYPIGYSSSERNNFDVYYFYFDWRGYTTKFKWIEKKKEDGSVLPEKLDLVKEVIKSINYRSLY